MPTIFNPKRRNAIFINTGGTVSPTPAPPSFNNTKSLLFDGVDEYVSLGVPTYLQSTSKVSVSLWVKFTAVGTNDYTTLFTLGSSNPRDLFLRIVPSGTSRRIEFGVLSSFVRATDIHFSNLVSGIWYHIMGCYDKDLNDGTDAQIYLNGTMIFEANTNSSLPASITNNIYLADKGLWGIFAGNIDEVSVWNSDQRANVSSVFNSGKPNNLNDLPTPPNQWYRNGDNSTYKLPQILMPENTNKDKVSNYSFSMDGVDDYIDCGNAFTETGAFSVSAWINTSITASTSVLYKSGVFHFGKDSWYNGGVGGAPYLSITDSGGITKTFRNGVAPSGATVTIGTVVDLKDGNWHHIAFTYDGINQGKYYSDGVLSYTYDITDGSWAGTIASNSNSLLIGKTTIANWNGNIDEVSIYDSALNSTQISDIFNSAIPTTITGATAYWKLGEEAKFTDNWLVPNSALSNYSKFSFAFDGVDDSIGIGTTSLGITSAISVSAWVKTTDILASYKVIIAEDTSSSTDRNWLLILNSSRKVQFAFWHTDATFSSITRATIDEISDGNWHHILATYDGTANADGIKLYIDGNLESATAGSTGIRSAAGVEPYIGSLTNGNAWRWNGNIDEVSVFDAVKVVADVSDGTEPIDLTGETNLVAWWQMGENASFNTNWTVPDQVGSNDGTSANMTIQDLQGEAPNYSGSGISNAMTIEDRVGNAPNSTSNAVSYNMESTDIDNDTP